MAWAGTTKAVDNFARAQVISTTSAGEFGWTIKDTSAAGTPTYLCITEDGGACKLTLDAQNEAENVCLYQADVLPYDIRKLTNMWWVAKVAGVAANTVLSLGCGSARNDDEDLVATSAWFKMEGATSTTALVVETDDATNEQVDVATGSTLAAVYKKMLIDFSGGLANVRFYLDGARVASGTTFDMSDVAAGQNVQALCQLSKASSTDAASVTIAQFGVTYNWTYGA